MGRDLNLAQEATQGRRHRLADKELRAIPVMKPKVVDPKKSLHRLRDVAVQGVFSNFGPQVRELENRLAKLFGVLPTQVVTAVNATLAITGAIAASQAKSLSLPAWTFAATAHAAALSGRPFRFVDVSPESWMIDVNSVTEQGLASILVLPFGAPLTDISWGDEDEVIVDAAASFGSMFDQFPHLPRNTSLIFSLHATKVFGVGEGAIVVFGDAKRANSFRSWSNFGFAGSRDSLLPGLNAKMPEYVAALLHTELDKWPLAVAEWRKKRKLADMASDELGLSSSPGLRDSVSPYWICLFHDPASREAAEDALTRLGIESRRWWGSGLHRMSAFSRVPHEGLAETDSIASRYLGLPFFRSLTDREVKQIQSAIADSRQL